MNDHFKITFRLASPVIYIDPPLFDAMIARCWVDDETERETEFERLYIPENELLNFSAMPIMKHKDGYFLASQMFGKGDREEVFPKRKKWEDEYDYLADFGRHKRKVNVQSGQYKSYELPRVAHTFESAHPQLPWSPFGHVWFYFVGDDREIVRLINNHLVGIGKDVNTGKGSFSDYLIESVSEEFDAIRMRPIPADTLKSGFKMLRPGETMVSRLMPPSPPYWDSKRAVRCSMIIKKDE